MLDIRVNPPLVPSVEDCDLTLLGAREDFDANIVTRPIASSDGILCASSDYLERYGTPQQPEALAQHRCLRLKQPSTRHRSWQLINPEHGKRKVDIAVEPAILANHSETLLHASVMGAGISAQSINIDSDILTSLINSEALKCVLSPWINGRHTLYASLPGRKFMRQRTSVLPEFMMDCIRRMIHQMEKKSR